MKMDAERAARGVAGMSAEQGTGGCSGQVMEQPSLHGPRRTNQTLNVAARRART